MLRYAPGKMHRSRGQAIAETALLLPLFLTLALGIEELGRAAYANIITTDAAYAGATYGAQSNVDAIDDTGMENAATADKGAISSLQATATHVCECSSGGSAPDCALSDCTSGARLIVYTDVTTTSTFTPICTFPGLPTKFTITAHAYLRAKQ